MQIEEMRALVSSLEERQRSFVAEAAAARRYYRNDNDIRRFSGLEEVRLAAQLAHNPLRSADFRIAHNWHQLLVDQKAAYLFTWPPTFESGDRELNGRIGAALGERLASVVKEPCVEAANCGVAWLHLWLDERGRFRYAPVPFEQVLPLYSDSLDRELAGVVRRYVKGERTCYELWRADTVEFFECEDGQWQERGSLCHPWCGVPFVAFCNNGQCRGDLPLYKDLIDQYDRVISGYANDLSDIQEVIFVLRNYGGEDLATFLSELKRYKAIKVEGAADAGGVETMNIDIPIEARVRFLELLRKQIFISGQGVDPDPGNFGNASGVALKYLYSLLEIKAGLVEGEFRSGFARLLRFVLTYLGADPDLPVRQFYTRNAIENEQEVSAIAQESAQLLSRRTLLRNHPWVEDAEEELSLLEQ